MSGYCSLQASGVYGAVVAESVHRDIRRLGGVRPPREFVFMDRAAVGLGSVFLHLKAEINWYRLFHELIEDFDERNLAARQQMALAAAGVPTEALPAPKRSRRQRSRSAAYKELAPNASSGPTSDSAWARPYLSSGRILSSPL